MSNLNDKAAELRGKMQQNNPSVAPGKTAAERKRIPLSLPQLKLQVPEIPGYHLHWFRGTQARIQQARNAGYEFVTPDEVQLNAVGLGGDATHDGNTDMGSRVSVTEGSEIEGGQAVRLFLMKQKMEYYLEDQKLAQSRSDSVADTLTASYRGGMVGGLDAGETRDDAATRYVDRKRTTIPSLFQRKK